MSNEIKREAGPNREFSTGAEKQIAEGKGTPVLVPGDAILEIAKHFEGGALIYGARNWEKGIPLSEILNSLERHLQQEKMGLTDEPHARALTWNAIVYLATKIRIERGLLPKELDDMPKYKPVDKTAILDGWSLTCGVLGCEEKASFYNRPLKMSLCFNHNEMRGD